MREILMSSDSTSQSLLKATAISIVIAVIALVLFILPAEYNIDPTGIGQKLGLSVFNQQAKPLTVQDTELNQQDSTVVIVPAGRGVEYKLAMAKFAKVSYRWTTDGAVLFVDLHGEPKGDTTGYFESYTVATINEMQGSFTAPFEGSHGWYWKNTSDQDIKVELSFKGDYEIEGLK